MIETVLYLQKCTVYYIFFVLCFYLCHLWTAPFFLVILVALTIEAFYSIIVLKFRIG